MAGDLCFRITEIGITAEKLLLHVEMERLYAQPFQPYLARFDLEEMNLPPKQAFETRFGLVRSDGKVVQAIGRRLIKGSDSDQADEISFPGTEQKRSFVELFPAPEDGRITFSPTINDRAIFGSINLRQSEFQSF